MPSPSSSISLSFGAAGLFGAAGAAIVILMTGCSSARIAIESTPPQAEVYASPASGAGKPVLLGVTPLAVSGSDLVSRTGNAGPVMIEFRKEGYNSSRAVITDVSAADLKLRLDLPRSSGLEDQDRMNAMIDLVFESQRLALAGRFADALAKLKEVQKQTPQLAAAYELEAGIYFMQKRLPEALDTYRAAARINPRNAETIRMRNYLEAKLGLAKAAQ